MTAWTLVYEGFNPAAEGHREALCTLGNGYFATRGAAAETDADETHYPGTYLAGGYDRATTDFAGRAVENEDLVNLPNWLPLTFRTAGGGWFNPLRVELLAYRFVLGSLRVARPRVEPPVGPLRRRNRDDRRRHQRRARPHGAAAARLPPAPDHLAAHDRSRRRGARARLAR